jgi:UDP-N-acetylglucosamine 1-carboxyvinyltransferase
MIVGPLLARCKMAYIPKPGGDKIGRRRLDTHFTGLQKLGADFFYDSASGFYSIKSDEFKRQLYASR